MIDISNFDWGWMNEPVTYNVNGEIQYLWRINQDNSVIHMSEFHKNSLIS
jgi:hypothetical protein